MSRLPPINIFAFEGIPKRLSSTTRNGWREVSTSRTFNRGSSANTVPIPVIIAQERARWRCTSCRAAAPVIHWLTPLFSAPLPSRLLAVFMRSHGVPRVIRATNPRFNSRASCSSKPDVTWMPALCNFFNPSPATSGFGSCMAATTRVTPASIKASAHGGVRP